MATITSKKANNWVDRGEAPGPVIERQLAHFFRRHADEDFAWLRDHANAILGMVAGDATEVHVVGYLRSMEQELGEPRRPAVPMRILAVSLWHIAKAALVRDLAERVLRGDIPPNDPTPGRLSSWIAARLLTAEELAAFEREADRNEGE
jgi:hypothetical protein